MPTVKLTNKAVENAAAPAGKRLELWDAIIGDDASLPGTFGLRVSETGVKSWQVMYRVAGPDGRLKQRRMALGTYPAYGLSEAREKAREALKLVGRGIDPADARKVAQTDAALTVELAVGEFMEKHVKAHNRRWRETERIFSTYVLPRWRSRPLSSITRADVVEVLDAIRDGGAPYMANRVRSALSKFWNWCLEKGRAEVSPVTHVRAPSPETSRDRVLTEAEIFAVWSGCAAMAWPFGPFIQLMLVTGQRRDEVAGMRWADLDMSRPVWTLPRTMTKSDRLHEVPLTPLAMEVLNAVPRLGGEYVFSTNGRTPVSGFSKAKTRLDELIVEARRQKEVDAGRDPAIASGLAPWRFHDLRRTVASGMARLRVEPWVVEKVLNHASGQLSGVAGVYNRYGYFDEKRDALALWAAHLESLLKLREGNVLCFAERGKV